MFPPNQNDEQEQVTTDYQVKPDVELTQTEIKEIERQKEELLQELAKTKAIREVIEIVAIKASIYAVARILLLLGGQIGIYFCLSSLLISFGIDNKNFFKDDTIQYDSGIKVQAMNKLLKVVLSLGSVAFFAYTAVGDYLGLVRVSNDAYRVIDEKIEKFNTPQSPEDKLITAVLVGAGVTFVVMAGSQILGGKK